jgi:hypothetical protein
MLTASVMDSSIYTRTSCLNNDLFDMYQIKLILTLAFRPSSLLATKEVPPFSFGVAIFSPNKLT